MTRETAKSLLPIITAFAEGKTIQWKDCESGEWHDERNMTFSLHYDLYRIKPEPREFWAELYNQTGLVGGLHDSCPSEGKNIIRVREVID